MSKFRAVFLSVNLTFCVVTASAAERPILDRVAATFAHEETRRDAPDEEVLAFSLDVTGDGIKEHFVTLPANRNGKRGSMWGVYSEDAAGRRLMDFAEFSYNFFMPYGNEAQNLPQGLYTYWPGGAGVGRLICYQFTGGAVIERDLGEVEPRGKDKQLFDTIFGNVLEFKSSLGMKSYQLQELKAMPVEPSLPSLSPRQSVYPPPPSLDEETPNQNLAEQKSRSTKSTQIEILSDTPVLWGVGAVTILAALGLLWLLLKKRK